MLSLLALQESENILDLVLGEKLFLSEYVPMEFELAPLVSSWTELEPILLSDAPHEWKNRHHVDSPSHWY